MELQQCRWVVRGPPCCLRNYATKAELDQVEPINEYIDGTNRFIDYLR